MERELAVFNDAGLVLKTGTYPKIPKGTVFSVEVGVLRNSKKIHKHELLTFPLDTDFGDDAE